MEITLIGMNHKTAPVAVRERLAQVCRLDESPLEKVRQCPAVDELFYLSTCNRVEFLFTTANGPQALEQVKELMFGHLGLPGLQLESHLYVHHDLEAVRHLFRVASSLDSMVVGEPQILGQIKAAYREATQRKTVGVVLNRLLHKTFSVAKRVRTETNIGCHAVSISYAAVELARKIFGRLHDKRIMLVGAGEMAELGAQHLLAQRVRDMVVVNRTLERALELAARFGASTAPFENLLEALVDADIVISSTGSIDPIVTYRDLKPRMRRRKNRPLFFIDIAVPRDIDPEVNRLDNVYLYDIDDLQGIVDLNLTERRQEAQRAEHIIESETLRFQQWLQTLDVVPTIIALRRKAEAIRQAELKRTLSQLPDLGEREREAIAVLTDSILKKMLHDPIVFLKHKSGRESKRLFVDFTQQLFNLNEDRSSSASSLDSHER
ncbi:glutamyl-tRNA reductase [Desulfacinum hydrothermale DSM 13146]|uniref:Glutamyl-tRNA reductase n=1 Tax=Desulfacinum hydrothermale DSM 13146 TaxID=1121390 RepID=A0A1W1XKL8_9BACT|nr:glutamyl-tRNA reductase [Desulfacinum hydrothermale]SMC24530.1 glutamyl-tRNA reductase [Desulfacinum hydrothermale DSM 13146]